MVIIGRSVGVIDVWRCHDGQRSPKGEGKEIKSLSSLSTLRSSVQVGGVDKIDL